MSNLNVPDSPKMLRETLCVAQVRIDNSPLDAGRRDQHIDRLQRLIDECDRHRPLGPNGKHGDRHTTTCGCVDDQLEPAQLDEQRRGWRGWLLDHAAADVSYEQIEWVVVALLDIGIDEPPEPPEQPDRPEPVDPASVKVGDIVEIEHTDGSSYPFAVKLADLAGSMTWPRLRNSTVRVLQRAEPEPDPAAVEALRQVMRETFRDGSSPDVELDEEWIERHAAALAKRNVRVVSTDA